MCQSKPRSFRNWFAKGLWLLIWMRVVVSIVDGKPPETVARRDGSSPVLLAFGCKTQARMALRQQHHHVVALVEMIRGVVLHALYIVCSHVSAARALHSKAAIS